MQTIEKIDRAAVKQLIDAGTATVVEALGPMYYADAHLPGALNLPHDQVDDLAPRLLPDKGATVVVYCSNTPCPNSTIAARRLAQLGYTHVLEYVEGKQDWVEAGYPVERGA